MIAYALAVLLFTSAPPAAGQPPPVNRLFGCPLLRAPAELAPPSAWPTRRLRGVGVSMALPRSWKVDESPGVSRVTAPRGDLELVASRSQLPEGASLQLLKRTLEARRLGPSHLSRACERELSTRLVAVTKLERPLVGVYWRPLGKRQRSYSLFAKLGKSAGLAVVVTIKWQRGGRPDLTLVRRVLAAVRRP